MKKSKSKKATKSQKLAPKDLENIMLEVINLVLEKTDGSALSVFLLISAAREISLRLDPELPDLVFMNCLEESTKQHKIEDGSEECIVEGFAAEEEAVRKKMIN